MPQRKPIRTKNTDVPSTAIESGAMSVMDYDANARYAISYFWRMAQCQVSLHVSNKRGAPGDRPSSQHML
jgi:hypothetical protein